MSEAHDLGRQAHRDGLWFTDNPYRSLTQYSAFCDWIKGWEAEAKEQAA